MQVFINFQVDTDNSSFQVNVMHNVNGKSCFQWPSSEDKLMYPSEDILRKMEPPTPVNLCGDFGFAEENINDVEMLLKEKWK